MLNVKDSVITDVSRELLVFSFDGSSEVVETRCQILAFDLPTVALNIGKSGEYLTIKDGRDRYFLCRLYGGLRTAEEISEERYLELYDASIPLEDNTHSAVYTEAADFFDGWRS